ncbi:MYND-type domain-containing protein [Favolaschia claudopus]|uniref:MYND-type domain-containing protein n=1 Tax=Favolaschia claudopus TaxID=2862362 RepID=A0AAW0A8J6_9AGAR
MIRMPLPREAQLHPEKWEADWEVLLSTMYRPSTLPKALSCLFSSDLQAANRCVDARLNDHRCLLKQTCELEQLLSFEALKNLAHDDFEMKWKRASVDERAKHVLQALATVCSVAKNLHDPRAYCPELRLTRLSADADAFLELLKTALLDDPSLIPTQPKYVSHPEWDAWAATQGPLINSEAEKVVFAGMKLLRTKLICHILYFAMQTFLGKDPVALIADLERKQKIPPNYWRVSPRLIESVGYDAAKADAKAHKADFFSRRGQGRAFCSYIGCSKPAHDASVKFPRCSRCFEKMNRQVLYCSRECQAADWSAGHKTVCGKPLNFDIASQPVEHPVLGPSATSPSRIGPTQNGFKRSLALSAQIAQLNLDPEVDYYLYNLTGEEEGWQILDPTIRELFRRTRDTAMTTGNSHLVAIMAHYMCHTHYNDWYDEEEVSPTCIEKQLSREFGIENLDELIKNCQRLQAMDAPRYRPYAFVQELLSRTFFADKSLHRPLLQV